MVMAAHVLTFVASFVSAIVGLYLITDAGHPVLGGWMLGGAVHVFAFSALLKGVQQITEALEGESTA